MIKIYLRFTVKVTNGLFDYIASMTLVGSDSDIEFKKAYANADLRRATEDMFKPFCRMHSLTGDFSFIDTGDGGRVFFQGEPAKISVE